MIIALVLNNKYNTMFKTQNINALKNNPEKLDKFVRTESCGDISYLLRKLGKLSLDFDQSPLLHLLKKDNDNVRYLAVKNLAKLSNPSLIGTYKELLKSDPSAKVRRESVSAIGRLRRKESIPILLGLLDDYDPEVVLQAIRGLLVFKKDNVVKDELKKLSDHPNEIIRVVIDKEFNHNLNDLKYEKTNHTQSPDFMKNVVVQGDVREIIKYVPDESIHLTFTSPPYYNARDYSIYQSYEAYLKFLEEVFKEVYRVTKEGRFFILNTSPIIIPRVSRQHSSKRYPIPYDVHPLLVKMGWEFIDDIIWLKPESSVKNRNAGFLQHRKPPAYKANPCTESVMVYRKKTDKLIDWNIRQYDWGIVNKSRVNDEYETSNVWRIDPVFDKTHSAVFPLELCNRVIKFYSYVGDLVFDPFAGSGTFGKSALNLNRYFFLTETKSEYIERINENIKQKTLSEYYKTPTFLDLETFISNTKRK